MSSLNQNRDTMQELLENAQTIAVVGHSDKNYRTSYQIANYLRAQGYTIIPVNPTVDTIDGEKSYASLADVPIPIDMVNVFRRSEHLAGIVDEAIALNIPAIWTQLGVIDINARDKAIDAGIKFAMDLCIKVEHRRLGIPHKA
ncbi:MAG: CoA-binding protein [Phototrophicaceae bacterium]